jgi:Ca-activated chloride channel family protein
MRRRVEQASGLPLLPRPKQAGGLLYTTFVVLLLLVAVSASAQMSRRERKEKIAKLSDEHRQFLIDVEPIILPTETVTFLGLETDPQRDAFIDDFWRRRDQIAGTSNQAAKDQYYARLEEARINFGQVSSDRSRIFLIHGQAAMADIDCPQYFQPLQIWHYEYLEGFGHDIRLLFYVPRNHRDYRLWNPLGGAMALDELRSGDSISGGIRTGNIIMDCKNGELILAAIGQMQQNMMRISKVFDPPKINEEDVNRILRSVVLSDPNAPKLTAEISVGYPGGDGHKTDAQLTILVPRAQLKTTTVSGTSVYTLDVVGEVLRDGKMWEKYRYRFDFPGTIADEKLPIVIDRLLRPAEYKSRVRITDSASGAQVILENDLTVPEVKIEKKTEESVALAAIRDDLQSTRAKLRIIPLDEGVTSGIQTIQTIVTGAGIKAVEFWLDGKKIATRRAPPYTLDLDFGTVPRSRKVRVVALDSQDQVITGDEIIVNTGTDPFRVRISSPRVAPKVSGPTKVEIDVRVPEGKELQSVDLYWNEQRIATMFDPPFVQTVHIPSTEGVGYLRAVASVKDPDIDPVEDLVLINTPDYMEAIDVHLIELPTSVVRDGKFVDNLQETSFRVFDGGKPVKLAKFEQVRDLPLSIGMAVDTSGSMDSKMTEARNAGAAFFRNVLRKGDKAFVVAFDSQPHMIQKWSNDTSEINSGLARLRPEESTALYDAVVYSLYNFLGVKGQKALVLVTDGKDTSSKFTYDQALEYAQRAAVPIYTIGIGIRATELDVRMKLNKLAHETGGSPYYIDAATELIKIYTDIQNELRSQYVLGFYPDAEVKPGGKWREVSVQTAEGKVKTIRGYYP